MRSKLSLFVLSTVAAAAAAVLLISTIRSRSFPLLCICRLPFVLLQRLLFSSVVVLYVQRCAPLSLLFDRFFLFLFGIYCVFCVNCFMCHHKSCGEMSTKVFIEKSGANQKWFWLMFFDDGWAEMHLPRRHAAMCQAISYFWMRWNCQSTYMKMHSKCWRRVDISVFHYAVNGYAPLPGHNSRQSPAEKQFQITVCVSNANLCHSHFTLFPFSHLIWISAVRFLDYWEWFVTCLCHAWRVCALDMMEMNFWHGTRRRDSRNKL